MDAIFNWEVRWLCDGHYYVDKVQARDLLGAIDAVKKKRMGNADFEHRFFSIESKGEVR